MKSEGLGEREEEVRCLKIVSRVKMIGKIVLLERVKRWRELQNLDGNSTI